MNSKQNDNENPKELFSEALNDTGLKFVIYAFLAGVVFVTGKFFGAYVVCFLSSFFKNFSNAAGRFAII